MTYFFGGSTCRAAVRRRFGSNEMFRGACPLFFFGMLLACTEGATAEIARTPLTSVGITETIDARLDPDDPGVGGGFDAAVYFKNVLASTVASCTAKVTMAADSWIAAQKLAPILRDSASNHILIDAAKSGDGGFFEISYRFSLADKRARVTVFYVADDGRLLEPAAIASVLATHEIAALQEALEKALRCGDL